MYQLPLFSTGINPSVLNHIMERLLFCHSTINFKSVDMAELFHRTDRTNFLGLNKREKDRKNNCFFICILFNLATIRDKSFISLHPPALIQSLVSSNGHSYLITHSAAKTKNILHWQVTVTKGWGLTILPATRNRYFHGSNFPAVQIELWWHWWQI